MRVRARTRGLEERRGWRRGWRSTGTACRRRHPPLRRRARWSQRRLPPVRKSEPRRRGSAPPSPATATAVADFLGERARWLEGGIENPKLTRMVRCPGAEHADTRDAPCEAQPNTDHRHALSASLEIDAHCSGPSYCCRPRLRSPTRCQARRPGSSRGSCICRIARSALAQSQPLPGVRWSPQQRALRGVAVTVLRLPDLRVDTDAQSEPSPLPERRRRRDANHQTYREKYADRGAHVSARVGALAVSGVATYAWEARKHPARLRRVLLETAALLGGHGLCSRSRWACTALRSERWFTGSASPCPRCSPPTS